MHAISLLADSHCHDLLFGYIVVCVLRVCPPHSKKRQLDYSWDPISVTCDFELGLLNAVSPSRISYFNHE
ncbi:hypothetical protein HZS_6604 [Henneguya salminicola]|nr:hypothetical protein HZS_6604 [Henneguya salminicola]